MYKKKYTYGKKFQKYFSDFMHLAFLLYTVVMLHALLISVGFLATLFIVHQIRDDNVRISLFWHWNVGVNYVQGIPSQFICICLLNEGFITMFYYLSQAKLNDNTISTLVEFHMKMTLETIPQKLNRTIRSPKVNIY